ncbi:MAG TPA: hypothetical protein VJ746_06010 [Nitrospira sp.]|nr:hypothetical protein [Nitrospira sp.]
MQEICEALHISVRDLFYEEPGPVARRRTVPATRIDKRTIALQFDVHADALRERGHAVLSAAVGLNISEWMDHELDKAISAVAHAHHDLQRASLLEDVADRLRCRDWEERRARQHAA